MRLVINVRGLMPGQAGGLETAFREIFGRILEWRLPELQVALLTSSHNHDSFASWAELADLRPLPDDASPTDLDRELEGADLLYCPLLFLEPQRPRIPAVVFMPDLQHETHPGFFESGLLAARTTGLRAAAGRAEAVITISEFSARRIRRSFRLPEHHVVPIHLDAAESFRQPTGAGRLDDLRRRLALPREWMLLPANSWPHKNHRRIFSALARYRERHGDPPLLLLTGALPSGADLEDEARAAGVGDLVRHLGWVEPSDMPRLYDGARCLLFATLYEGFGIPLVEAMRRGTPILANRGGCTAEITGGHAVTVDASDADSIADGLLEVLEDGPDTRAARAWAERFSYEESADATWRVLETAARRRAPRRFSVETWPRFFVVTPSLNQARYLRSTIDSVLTQPYPHLSYFVADGGSTDGSVEVLRSYGDRLRWVSAPDGGQAAAVSRAWQESDAEVVAYLNSDDVYLPLAISRVAEYLLRRPEAAAVYGKAWVIDEQGQRLRPYGTEPFDAERLAEICFISQPAAFLRREVFRVVAPIDPALRYCMDYDLWIRLSRWFELHYLEEFLAGSREHEETKTLRDRGPVYQEILQVTRRHYGVPARSWSVGAILARCGEEVERELAGEPEDLKARARALRAQEEEAKIAGPLYPDRWAGTATWIDVHPDANGFVRLRLESPLWPHREPLRVRVEQDGQCLCEMTLESRELVELDFRLPANGEGAAGARVLLRANRTFVPTLHGYSDFDERPLSFLLR